MEDGEEEEEDDDDQDSISSCNRDLDELDGEEDDGEDEVNKIKPLKFINNQLI